MKEDLKNLSSIDYAVFAAMLACCSSIGLYFGYKDFRGRKSKLSGNSDAVNYLMGGRQMMVFPVALSLIASLVSGVLLLGASTEIYLYGTQYVYIIIAICLSALPLHFFMIPIFHDLQITSVYEYLQLRFDKKMRFVQEEILYGFLVAHQISEINFINRLFGSLMYTVSTILWLPIMIYVPALAFNQLTSINIHVITPIVMTICIFYTVLGGLKAVVWTDVIQITIMYGTLITIAVKGTMKVGGFSTVIERNLASDRIEAPDFNLDPTTRHTFWSLVVGGTILYTAHNGLNQNMMQRYLSLKSVKAARQGNVIYTVGMIVIILLCCYNGLLLYASYHDCNPVGRRIKTKDQLLPLLVMETFKDVPGLTGFFISGIFSAALSSISTGLNAMSAVVFEDFFKAFRKTEMSATTSKIVMRGTVLLLGILGVGLVYVVENLGTILQLTLSVPTACFGPLFGIYIIGFFLPWINKKATLLASIAAFISMMLYVFKVQAEMAQGHIKFSTKPTSIDGCMLNVSKDINSIVEHHQMATTTASSIYQISYLYYTFIGTLLVLLIASLLTLVLGFEDASKIDQNLLAPIVRKYGKPRRSEVILSSI